MSKQPFETLVNNGCIDESRVLKAPLALAAGGWGQISLWKSTDDESYRTMHEKVVASLKPLEFCDIEGTCGNPAKCRCDSCWVKETDTGWMQKQKAQSIGSR